MSRARLQLLLLPFALLPLAVVGCETLKGMWEHTPEAVPVAVEAGKHVNEAAGPVAGGIAGLLVLVFTAYKLSKKPKSE